MSVTAGPGVVISGTEQATVTVQLLQTGSTNLLATSDATNWVSSNPSVLTVSSSGLVTGVGVGSATVSAMVGGATGTSGSITVTPQVLLHRYSFASDASDSVGGANGTLIGASGGAAASITNGLNLPGNQIGGFGYSGYVSLPNGILTNTTSVTVECWVTQNQGNGWAEIWDFAVNDNVNFGLIPLPGNGPDMEVADNPNNDDIYTASSTGLFLEYLRTIRFLYLQRFHPDRESLHQRDTGSLAILPRPHVYPRQHRRSRRHDRRCVGKRCLW